MIEDYTDCLLTFLLKKSSSDFLMYRTDIHDIDTDIASCVYLYLRSVLKCNTFFFFFQVVFDELITYRFTCGVIE